MSTLHLLTSLLLSVCYGSDWDECAHFHSWPINECISESNTESFYFECTEEIFIAYLYNDDKCTQDYSNGSITIDEDLYDSLCGQADNACLCNDIQCNSFSYTSNETCTSKYDVEYDENRDTVVLNTCVSDSSDTGYSYIYICDEDTNYSVPITRIVYNDDKCEEEINSCNIQDECYFLSTTTTTTTAAPDCEYDSYQKNCSYQIGINNNNDNCSHFMSYPLNICDLGTKTFTYFDYIGIEHTENFPAN